MPNVKYAIRFPDLQSLNYNKPSSIFSEDSIIEAADKFIKTFDAFGNLIEFVIQENKTNELSRQLNAQKRALDSSIDNLKEQKLIEFEEYTKRLQTKLHFEKENMKLEREKLVLEASARVNDFSVNFEESMRNNQVLYNMICKEAYFLYSINDYIENLADDYSHRTVYAFYCELHRKTLELVRKYMEEIVLNSKEINMKKMNYSNFEDNIEIIPASSVEVLDIQRNENSPTAMVQSSGDFIANAISPAMAIANLANTALGTISDISKCITMVSIEKQRTKQVEAQACVQIEESIQQTNRSRIQEKEITKRLIIQCKANLANKEHELKKLRKDNLFREKKLNQNHRLYIESLDLLSKMVESITDEKNSFLKLIPNMVDNSQNLEMWLHYLNNINTNLVEISKKIVELKKG